MFHQFQHEIITEQNVITFRSQGFLVFPKFLSDKGLREVETALEQEIALRKKSLIPETSAAEIDGEIKVLAFLDKESNFFFDFGREAIFRDISEQLMGQKTVPLFVEYFNKPPKTGSSSPLHQDQAFYRFLNAEAISFWIAIDDTTESNGCLHYATELPRKLLRHRMSSAIGFAQELDVEAYLERMVPVELSAGGCVIHHSLAIHLSGENPSGRSRRAVVVNYKTVEFPNIQSLA